MLSLNGLINLIKTNIPPPFLKAMRECSDFVKLYCFTSFITDVLFSIER